MSTAWRMGVALALAPAPGHGAVLSQHGGGDSLAKVLAVLKVNRPARPARFARRFGSAGRGGRCTARGLLCPPRPT